MATPKLLYISRALMKPAVLQSLGGSTCQKTGPLVRPLVFRTITSSAVSSSKSGHDYYILNRYEVLRCGDVEKLIKKRSSPEDPPIYYVYIEETYAIIQRAHIATGHASGAQPIHPGEPVTDVRVDIISGEYKKENRPGDLKHFRTTPAANESTDPAMAVRDPEYLDPKMGQYALPHPIWSEKEIHSVVVTHREPKGMNDRLAYLAVRMLRGGYDLVSGYSRKNRDEALWLKRIIFLETVAGVPGMVAAMVRHLHSLRMMKRDHGWIHTLLEEAENERMHLMTAMQLKQPTMLFKVFVVGAQAGFVTMFSVAYLISPTFCHRFVGYLEEEAVVTYTKCLLDIENGELKHWQTTASPPFAIRYWSLAPAATMKDVILAIRADEAHHRIVNHSLASMKPDEWNPYKPGQ